MAIILASEARNLLKQLKTDYGFALEEMKIAAITTAMLAEVDNAHWYAHEIYCWNIENIFYDEIDIAGYDYERLCTELAGYDAVYVVGGHTHYLLSHLKQCEFETWLDHFLKQGGLYIGTCAGSMVMGPSIDHVNLTPCKYEYDLPDQAGFNYFDKRLVCHVNWENEHISLVKKHRALYGQWRNAKSELVALNDKQGVLIENGIGQILGC